MRVLTRRRGGHRPPAGRRLAAVVAAAWVLAFPCLPVRADLPETIARIKPSLVGVGTVEPTRRPPWQFLGTGFAVADGRHALTNAHVLPEKLASERREVLAVLTGSAGREDVREARVVASDPEHDLALLRFDGTPLPAMRLEDSDRVREGERYAFSGFPLGTVLGRRPVTHQALVSAITPIAIPQPSARSLDPKVLQRLSAPYDVFQLDATAYPGNSGSPVYDPASGRVVGIVNRVFVKESKENLLKDPSGITYAIPSNHAAALLRRAGLKSSGG